MEILQVTCMKIEERNGIVIKVQLACFVLFCFGLFMFELAFGLVCSVLVGCYNIEYIMGHFFKVQWSLTCPGCSTFDKLANLNNS